jgi:hypothetical protein
MRNVSESCSARENTHFMFNIFFSKQYTGSYFHGLSALELGGVLVKGITGFSPQIQCSVVQGV